MRALAFVLCLLGVVGAVEVASATTVEVDFIVIQNPTVAVFGDLFDGAALANPPWIPTGSPGPQAGGLLELDGGDGIVAPLALNPAANVLVQSSINLPNFGAGSAVAMTLGAGRDSVGLVVTPTYSFVGNSGGILGLVPLDPGASAFLSLGVDPLGNIAAAVNGTTVYAGAGASPLSIDSISLQVLPEPATGLAGLLVAGALALRRSRSGRVA